MKINNLGMLLQEGNRSKAYLQALIEADLLPNFVLLLQNPDQKQEALNTVPAQVNSQYYDPRILETKSLEQAKIPYQVLAAKSCNEDQVVAALKERPEDYFIFSGSGILKQVFTAGKKLIHAHPGKLPEYRGSTCPYYSSLAEDKWYGTAFIMKPGIDEGDIIIEKEFPLPQGEVDPTRIYDPYTRSKTIIEVVQQLADTGSLKTNKQDLSQGITYYLIHPVLEFIAKESFKINR